MKYLKPELADHPQASARLKAEVAAFYEREALIAAWDRARRARAKAKAKNDLPALEKADTAEALLGEIEQTVKTLAKLRRKTQKLTARHGELVSELNILLQPLSEDERQPKLAVLDRIDRQADAGPKAKGQTDTARAALTLLARSPSDEVRPAQITKDLRKAGFEVSDNYGASMLHVWQKSGLVSRVAHGRYAIDRSHPDLIPYELPGSGLSETEKPGTGLARTG